jgi:DNA-directed RNA polymerase I and III subunit RPAC1
VTISSMPPSPQDHFIFTVESTGILPPDVLVMQALSILQDKADRLSQRL